MRNRLELQSTLERLLGTRDVYYQPPESMRISYPAIVYSKMRMSPKFADDSMYLLNETYSVTLITKNPDTEIPKSIIELPYCMFDRRYVADGLYHDVFTITI